MTRKIKAPKKIKTNEPNKRESTPELEHVIEAAGGTGLHP